MQPLSEPATQNSVCEFTIRENEFAVGIETDFVVGKLGIEQIQI